MNKKISFLLVAISLLIFSACQLDPTEDLTDGDDDLGEVLVYVYPDETFSFGGPIETEYYREHTFGDWMAVGIGAFDKTTTYNFLNKELSLESSTINGVEVLTMADSFGPFSVSLAIHDDNNKLYFANTLPAITKSINATTANSVLQNTELMKLFSAYGNSDICAVMKVNVYSLMRTIYWQEMPAELKAEVDKYEVVWGFGLSLDSKMKNSGTLVIYDKTDGKELVAISMAVELGIDEILDLIEKFKDDEEVKDFFSDNFFTGFSSVLEPEVIITPINP